MRIAIATSDEEKEWYQDIDMLAQALISKGLEATQVVWDSTAIEWEKFDIVYVDSVWDYMDKYEAFISWCVHISKVSKLVNSFDVVSLASNKEYLFTLADAGVTIPASRVLSPDSTHNDLGLDRTKKVIAKPLIGANGVDTYLYENTESMNRAQSFRDLRGRQDVLVQEFIEEIETLGELGAIFIAGRLSHCVLKMPSGSDFRVQHQYGGVTTLTEAPDYTTALYDQIVKALGVNPTYARIDFVPTATPTVMEVEMIEPNKYISLYPPSAELLAEAIAAARIARL